MCFGYDVVVDSKTWVLFNMMEIKVSGEMVTNLSEKSRLGFADLKDRFGVLRNVLKEVVGDDDHGLLTNPNCHIIQDGLILRASCQLYESGFEEVSVWRWPYQTTGLVRTEFDSRSFTVLSGRVTETSKYFMGTRKVDYICVAIG